MKAPVEPSLRRRSPKKGGRRSSGGPGILTLFWRDVRRHPALAVLLCGYVAIFATGWWFYFAAPEPASTSVEQTPTEAADETLDTTTARSRALLPPQPSAAFGTDRYGRGVLTRVLRGAAETLSVALVGSAGAVALGFAAVFVIGWALGSRGYGLLTWLGGGIGCLPALALAWWLSAAVEPGFWTVCGIIAVTGAVPVTDRLARAFAECESRWHIVAAAAAGFGRLSVLRTQVIPLVWPRLVSYGAMLLPGAVLLETALTFAGLGLGSGSPDSWGRLIAEGRSLMFDAPWIMVTPGLVIAVTVGWLSLTARSIRKVTHEKDFLSLV